MIDRISDLMPVTVSKNVYLLRETANSIFKTNIRNPRSNGFLKQRDFDVSPDSGSPTHDVSRSPVRRHSPRSLIQSWRSAQPEIVKSIHGKICVNDVPGARRSPYKCWVINKTTADQRRHSTAVRRGEPLGGSEAGLMAVSSYRSLNLPPSFWWLTSEQNYKF